MARQSKFGGWLAAAACAAIVSGGVVAVQSHGQDAADAPAVDLGPEMQAINADYSQINRDITDASKNASTLKTLDDMEKHVINAKEGVPPNAATQPAADRAAYLAGFRGELIKLERALLDVDEAVSAGNAEKVATTWAAIKPIETEGHAEFRARPRGARRGN